MVLPTISGDVEAHLALVVERRHVRIVRCQSFVPRPDPNIV